MGSTGPLSPGEKEDTLPLINPFPRWGASVCKTCLLHWSKKTPSQTQLAVSGFCTGLPGSLGCPAPTINNTTRQELRGGREGLFSTFCKSGSVSNLSSAEAFPRLFGWAGRASPSASLGSSPRLRSSAAGPGDQRSELQPQALPLKADPPGTGGSPSLSPPAGPYPQLLDRFPPHWKQKKRKKGSKCPHALWLKWRRIKCSNSPKFYLPRPGQVPCQHRRMPICLERRCFIHISLFHPRNRPVGWDFLVTVTIGNLFHL